MNLIFIFWESVHVFLLLARNGGIPDNGNYTRTSSGTAGLESVQTSAGDSGRQRPELRIVIDGNLSSPIIDSLVLQTLAIIRTLVDKSVCLSNVF